MVYLYSPASWLSNSKLRGLMNKFRVESKKITSYGMFLKEPPRPPSRGGNTGALHSHVLEIEGEKFSFLALGSQQWVFKSDNVSFEYKIENGYKNIIKDTIVTIDRNGNVVSRGNRAAKTQLRSAPARLPGSRREQKD
ncbi:TPA: hypothetical protein L7614_004419 [Klebsiella pneumoniae subsp. pneumoniae]|nr:hypothetical protein [Klebsiella pneumoniae]HBQ5906362.1 hypothetical protein [Klebsiella pneumoniae subsp. pneumoniae]MBZ1657103.1 hypothetical protein [Klebsiella pneumoniae]HBQ5918010.1 hypothetical protein [Klebsiella pneumoniae subsp. pneumoniae]HBS5285577.1 hypothetical protein [Klebsiella pneumoniae]